MAKDYSQFSKEELLKIVEKLETRKKYGLIWDEEKVKEQFEKDAENALPVLKEISSKEITDKDGSKPVNILIEGDNYHALSVLNFTHQNKVDVIYIDPPYNTGKEDFKYNDKWVNEDDAYRHSKWLSFMSKRLKVANTLLKDNGIIFISIDDNESSQSRLLCDEIFGENNRLSTHHIQVRYGGKNLNERKDFQELIEYTFVYAKNKYLFEANKPREEYDLEKFNLEIKELRKPDKSLMINGRKVDIFLAGSYSITKKDKGDLDLFKETWISGSIYSGTGHGSMYQKVVEKRVETDGLSTLYKIDGLGEDGLGFRYMINPQRESSSRGKMFTKIPTEKKEALENGGLDIDRPIINYYDFSADFGNIRHEGGVAFNAGKKPVKMLKQFINYHKDKNVVVLDFFAGSGSTAHAVLDLNKEDGGDRSFVICTNNENDICEKVCYPRIKNVIKGWNGNDGFGGSLKYFKTKFVKKNANGDDFKTRITHECTEMLCLREGVFDEVKKTDHYRIFQQGDKTLAVYYSLDRKSLPALKKELEKMDGEKILYCFTLDATGLSKTEFANWHGVTLEPIPQKILDVYKQIYEY
jgi:adenine-specific DNA-methyltransferase